MARRRSLTVTREEAERGIYIDFEGRRNAPGLLGVLVGDDSSGEAEYTAYVVEPALHPAVILDTRTRAADLSVLARELAIQSRAEDRRVFAWSHYEASLLRDLGFGEFAGVVVNALTAAKLWLRAAEPQHPLFEQPSGQRHRLSAYLDIAGYHRLNLDPEHQPMKGLDTVRGHLDQGTEGAAAVPEEAHVLWTRTVDRNYDDCAGVRALLLHMTAG